MTIDEVIQYCWDHREVGVEFRNETLEQLVKLFEELKALKNPVPMLLWCPDCGARHIDAGKFATRVHHTHSCQVCGMTWRPAGVATVGVQFLPGFKNE